MERARFWGVASGLIGSDGGLFWTRYGTAPSKVYEAPTQAVSLLLELSRSADFSSIEHSISSASRPQADGTAKVSVTGLGANSTWFYRFRTGEQLSAVGRFRTPPQPEALAPLNMGVGGCANGRYAPYPVVAWPGGADPGLDLFVMLGDAAYGNDINYPEPIGRIQANPNPVESSADLQPLRQAIWTKMLLNLISINSSDPAQPELVPGSLASLYASQPVLALPDNKDLGDSFLEAGGAPRALLQQVIDALKSGIEPPITPNAEGTSLKDYFSTLRYYLEQGKPAEYVNQSPEYQALIQSFLDYLPVPDGTLAPLEAAAELKPLYGVTDWGRNARIITLDDRSYRDIKILDGNDDGADDDTSVRADAADSRDRTILGEQQLAWFKQQLLQAKADGVLWTIVNISSPIDATGGPGQDGQVGFGETSVDAKSFWGNYRWERNEILRFIAENNIRNVVFNSSDDHEFRVNELVYAPNPDPSSDGGEGLTKNLAVVPGVFTVVASPLGAARPDGFLGTNPDAPGRLVANFSSPTTYTGRGSDGRPDPTLTLSDGFVGQAHRLQGNMQNQGVDPIGLSAEYPGLRSLSRSVDLFDDNPTYTANVNEPGLLDFWSPQTFNWGQLQIDEQGLLTVSAWGTNAYRYNKQAGVDFDRVTSPVDEILSFQLAPSVRWQAPVERVGSSSLRFQDDQSLTLWRGDQGSGTVDFGFRNETGSEIWSLRSAIAGQQGSLSPESAVSPDPSNGWLASENRSVGSRAHLSARQLGEGNWTPIARRDGQLLGLESLTLEGTRVSARFQDGITGLISLPGSGTAEAPEGTQPLVSVKRLGDYDNGLAFYEADPVTGAVGELLPGDPGYLAAALAEAERGGRLLEASRLASFGASSPIEGLELDPSRFYGLLLLVQGDRHQLLSSFAAANPGLAPQMLSLGSDGRGVVIGIEDQSSVLGGSDNDFNDLIVRIDAGIIRMG
jgi:hypothetical protein